MLVFIEISLLSMIMIVSPAGFTDFALPVLSQVERSADNQQNAQHGLRHIPLVINELMASNSSTIRGSQGQYDDWIEIYNFGNTAVDVGGMYLTDDLTVPTKWQIPDNNSSATTITSHRYLLIWADENTTDTGLHANFKLSAGGEEIGLFDTDGGTLIDSITFGQQTTDISYGRYPDANDTLRFFGTPTPGAENNAGYLGAVADLEFSHQRGFYDEPFSVTITTETEGAVIYYTLDGSSPYDIARSVVQGTFYTRPIFISSTTSLRAVAFKPAWKPSKIETHTYIFNASGIIKSLPVISLVGDEGTTFFEPDGIMAIVGGYYAGEEWTSGGDPDAYNNPIHRGREYERPVSFEIIDSQLDTDMQIDCGIRVHGSNYTRPRYRRGDNWLCNNNKFSFNLFFRSSYGNNRLGYPFFPFVPVECYKSIALRAGHNDICSPFIKDEWVRRLFREMGAAQLTGTFANLYINGEYKGYYNPCGRLDEEFFQEWFDTDNNFDVIDQEWIPRDGDRIAWNALLDYAESHDLADSNAYEYVGSMVNIQEFIDYLILEIHIANFDWPNNNWAVYREKTDGAKFGFAIWDAEGVAETWVVRNNWSINAFDDMPSYDPQGLNGGPWDICRLYRALKANPEFRQLFADRIHKHYHNGGIMSEAHLLETWWKVFAEVSDVLPYQDTFVPDEFLPRRESLMLLAFHDNGLFNIDVEAPIFNINGSYQHGGRISAGDILNMTNPNSAGTVYYTLDGSDPGVPGTPPQQVIDIVLIAEDAPKRVLVPTGEVDDTWKGAGDFDDSGWMSVRGSTGGVGYERSSGYEQYIRLDVESQMYNRIGSCYIRIPFQVSGDPDTFDLMILKVRYDDGFVAYINGVEVQKTLVSGTPSWNSYASGNHEAAGLQPFDISNQTGLLRQGQNILAIHGLNVSRTSSDFLISAELVACHITGVTAPGISDSGIGYTGSVTLAKSTHVKARVLSNNTWSALNEATFAAGPVTENLRITEIMYNPFDFAQDRPSTDPNEEYIELTNIGTETINLNLVKFTDGINFTFPDIDIEPGQYIVVVRNLTTFTAQYGTEVNTAGPYSGSLNNAGERIELEDAIGQTILDFSYNDNWSNITDGQGYSLTIIDASNPDPNSWSAKDSWRASAYIGGSPGWDDTDIPDPGSVVINEVLAHSHAFAADWIELYNTTGRLINIGGWFISDSDPNLTKYEIADGTLLAPYGYIVFYEDLHFVNVSNPGCHTPFALSEDGETVYLTSAHDGELTGYRQSEDFGASQTGVSFGRYYKSSTDNFNFVAMSENTPGLANAYPKVGPVVINEIMYNPASGNQNEEYVELYNISSEPVTLYDYDKLAPWKFTDGIDFTFPVEEPVTIPAGGYLLLVKDLSAFALKYSDVPPKGVLGPYDGQLSNSGEKAELGTPTEADGDGNRYYIRLDLVNYSDGSHPQDCPGGVDLWPVEADGGGLSLSRRVSEEYGNDVANWQAASPSPGR